MTWVRDEGRDDWRVSGFLSGGELPFRRSLTAGLREGRDSVVLRDPGRRSWGVRELISAVGALGGVSAAVCRVARCCRAGDAMSQDRE